MEVNFKPATGTRTSIYIHSVLTSEETYTDILPATSQVLNQFLLAQYVHTNRAVYKLL